MLTNVPGVSNSCQDKGERSSTPFFFLVNPLKYHMQVYPGWANSPPASALSLYFIHR